MAPKRVEKVIMNVRDIWVTILEMERTLDIWGFNVFTNDENEAPKCSK